MKLRLEKSDLKADMKNIAHNDATYDAFKKDVRKAIDLVGTAIFRKGWFFRRKVFSHWVRLPELPAPYKFVTVKFATGIGKSTYRITSEGIWEETELDHIDFHKARNVSKFVAWKYR